MKELKIQEFSILFYFLYTKVWKYFYSREDIFRSRIKKSHKSHVNNKLAIKVAVKMSLFLWTRTFYWMPQIYFLFVLTLFRSGCSDSEQKPCLKHIEDGKQVSNWLLVDKISINELESAFWHPKFPLSPLPVNFWVYFLFILWK